MSDIYKQAEEQRREKITKIPVEETLLPNKIKTTLINAGYRTIGDIVKGLKNHEIYKVKGIGEKTINKLKKFIEKLNLPDEPLELKDANNSIVVDEKAIRVIYARIFGDSKDLDLKYIMEVLLDRLKLLKAEKEMCRYLERQQDELELMVLEELFPDER